MYDFRWNQYFKSRHVLRSGKGAAMRTKVNAVSCKISYLSHLTSYFGATMNRWTEKPKITWHRKKSKIFYINRIILEWLCQKSTTKAALKYGCCQNANLSSLTPQVFLDWKPVVLLVTTKLSSWYLPSFQLMWRVDWMSCCILSITDGVARVRA